MKNILGREGGDHPFEGAFAHQKQSTYTIDKQVEAKEVPNLDELFDAIDLKDGMTISFHHHMRNGDFVLNTIMKKVHELGIKDLTIAASSLFPCHAPLVPMFEDGTVTQVYTSYVSGPVAEAISKGKVEKPCYITTHGGRPRSILEDELHIDVAFVAAPAIGKDGAISGAEGPSACGSLGYAVADAEKADTVVAVTDNKQDEVKEPDIRPGLVDYIFTMDQIGDPSGIVSGTTQITKDPIGLRIAHNAASLIDAAGLIKDGFSFQTGAGGVSLAVANDVKQIMEEKEVKGSFGSGGITAFFVGMLEEGLFEELNDVQCFDNVAVESSSTNPNHHKISADLYANPNNPKNVAERLDCVVLGASEIDLDYNVNVTTGSDGIILGGSGGHADTATGADLTIITTKLFNARRGAIVDKVRTVSTPGEVIDAIVTEYGIAINPKRTDLLEAVKDNPQLEIKTIEELYDLSNSFTGKPKVRPRSGKPVAYSVYRDGTILDTIDLVED